MTQPIYDVEPVTFVPADLNDLVAQRGKDGWLPVANPTASNGGNLLLIFYRPAGKNGGDA